MKTIIFFSIVVLLFGIQVKVDAQSFRYSSQFHSAVAPEARHENISQDGESWPNFSLEAEPSESPDKKLDPAYKLYKKGYNLILEEKWEEARKTFVEVIKKYPGSEYDDDAEYWSAFALKHIDKNKAKEAYKKFILHYPSSNYYDDAVADYSDLNGKQITTAQVINDNGTSVYMNDDGGSIRIDGDDVTMRADSERAVLDRHGKVIKQSSGKKYSYSYSFAPSPNHFDGSMRRLSRAMSRMRVLPYVHGSLMFGTGEEKIDPQTRLKMDALYALGETREDSISFRTLRDVAIDRSQPHELREAAMDGLSNFSRFDVLPVFLEVARKDTNEEIQNAAIDYMGQLSKDKNRSVETLSELFYAIPKHRSEQLQTVLSSIAEIGNDKAIDFLSTIARTYEDYDLRSDAIYYLGNIGGDKARTALYEILKGK